MTSGCAKSFFENVRTAALDAERCRQQLEAMKHSAEVGASHGYGEKMGGGGGNAVERRLVAYVDHDTRLEKRRDEDLAMVDKACVVLYGADQMGDGGLCMASPASASIWADVLWWRYCAAAKWDEIADALGYSTRPLQHYRNHALRWIDANDFMTHIIMGE